MAEDDVWRGISWSYVGLRQVERVRQSFADFRAARFTGEPYFRRVTPEWDRPMYYFQGDVHFLISAVYHLTKVLDSVPEVRQPIGKEVPRLRGTCLSTGGTPKAATARGRGSWRTTVRTPLP